MVDVPLSVASPLGAASEQRKAPGREFERQVKMLLHGIDAEPEHGDVQKGRIGDCDSRVAEERADTEFHFLDAAQDAVSFGDRVYEMAVRGTGSFGDDQHVGLQSAQPHRQFCSRDAARDIDRVDGDAACFVPTGRFRQSASLSRFACANAREEPVMHHAAMQMRKMLGAPRGV